MQIALDLIGALSQPGWKMSCSLQGIDVVQPTLPNFPREASFHWKTAHSSITSEISSQNVFLYGYKPSFTMSLIGASLLVPVTSYPMFLFF